MSKSQSYSNHIRILPPFHMGGPLLLLIAFVATLISIFKPLWLYGKASQLALLALIFLGTNLWHYLRRMITRVQDRAIRAEEGLRHYRLTGEHIPRELTLRQIIGLRFASDAEYPSLVRKALGENLSEDAIKRAVQNWRADHDRA